MHLQDVSLVRSMMQRHVKHTGSPRAKALLADWPTSQSHFVKIFPHEFRRAMAEAEEAKVSNVAQAVETIRCQYP